MKKGLLLPLSIVCLLLVAGCTPKKPTSSSEHSEPESSEIESSEESTVESSEEESSEEESSEESSEEITYGVSITNKDTLGAEWRVGDAPRKVQLSVEPAGVIADLIADGLITIESDHPEIVSVAGQSLSAVGAGNAKVTVSYHDAKDTLDLTILEKMGPKVIYGTAHEGTEEDPFTNEDGVLIGNYAKENGDQTGDFYFKGVVNSFYHSVGSRDNGEVSFYLEPAEQGGTKFEIYLALAVEEDGKTTRAVTDDDIWLGAEVLCYSSGVTYYATGKQPETTGKVLLLGVTGGAEKPAPRQTYEVSFADMMAAGLALNDGGSSYDYYTFEGYVVKKDGDNYFLNATNEEAANVKDMFEIYRGASFAEKLLKGALVSVTCELKNYHGQIENNGNPVDITVKTAGIPWIINGEKVNVASALEEVAKLEDGKTSEGYYEVTGYVIAITSAYSAQHGNISFTMGDAADQTENLLTVFRMACTEAEATQIVAGAKMIITGKLQKYVKDASMTPELVNVVKFEFDGGEVPPVVEDLSLKITKANSGVGTTTLEAAKVVEYVIKDELKMSLEWSAGCFDYGSYDEVGVAKNGGYVKVTALPEGYKISTIEIDYYQYVNLTVFAGADNTGTAVEGTDGTASGLKNGVMKVYTIDGAAFYLDNASGYNQAIYSLKINLEEDGGEVPPVVQKNYYLVGGMNDWNVEDTTYALVKVEDNHYKYETIVVEEGKTVELKAYEPTEAKYFGNASVWDDCHFELGENGNVKLSEGEYIIHFYVESEYSNHITVDKVVPAKPAETIVFSEKGYSNGDAVTLVEGETFSVTFDKGTNSNAPKYYDTGKAIRVYGGGYFVIDAGDKNIEKIVITFASGEGTNEITVDAGTFANGEWTGLATSVKFSVGGTSGHRRIASIAVTLA